MRLAETGVTRRVPVVVLVARLVLMVRLGARIGRSGAVGQAQPPARQDQRRVGEDMAVAHVVP